VRLVRSTLSQNLHQDARFNQLYRFIALNYAPQLSPELMLTAGNQWAKIAKARIFVDLDDLSIEKLMVSISIYLKEIPL
jgi:hypothetical protein